MRRNCTHVFTVVRNYNVYWMPVNVYLYIWCFCVFGQEGSVMIEVKNAITGEVRELGVNTPEGAIYAIYDEWLSNATIDECNSKDIQFTPYYDDLRNVWFWNGWEVRGTLRESEQHRNNMMFSGVSLHDDLEVSMDIADFDGPTKDYETTIHIDAPTLYRLIITHAPECIVAKKVGDFYE